MKKKILFIICFIVFTIFDLNAEILSSARKIDWDAGVRGGIINRQTIYTNLTSAASASTIQTAIDNCPSNQVVYLQAGTYTISSPIYLKSYVTIRGAGISNTIISPHSSSFVGGSIFYIDNGFDDSWSGTARTVSPSPAKGDTSFSTSVAHGWSVGDVVLIDMLEQPGGDPDISNQGYGTPAGWVGRDSGTRCIGQMVRIETVPTSTSITFNPPLYWAYTNTPQGVKMSTMTYLSGLEEMTINCQTVSSIQDPDYMVQVEGGVNCWNKNIEFRGIASRSHWVYNALWFEVRGCIIQECRPVGTDKTSQYTSGAGYPVFLGPHATACLIEDNIIQKMTMGMCWEGNSSGNVFSYNFMTNMWWRNTGDSPRRFGPLMHGPHPMMNLIEGNWSAGRIRADETWGTSSHFTALRNRIVQYDRGVDDGQTWTIELERGNQYWSFIGNLLGGSSGGGVNEDNYELINGESAPQYSTSSSIWKLGYENLGEDATRYDSRVLTSALRWGNWSHRTNDSISGSGITWHTNNVTDANDFAIPNSYYLSSKPAIFGFLAWPPYDPNSPTLNSPTNIPAGYRFYFGTNPPAVPGQGGDGGTGTVESVFGRGKFNINIRRE